MRRCCCGAAAAAVAAAPLLLSLCRQVRIRNLFARSRALGSVSLTLGPSQAGHVARRFPLFLGSPAEVTDKILAMHEIFGFSRFVMQMAIGVMDHGDVMRAIELFGTKVAPELRRSTG